MRVAITGMGAVSSLGNSLDAMFSRLLAGDSAVKTYPQWRELKGLQSFLGAPAQPHDISHLPRSARRSMSRMSELSVAATLDAIRHAGLPMENSFRTCPRSGPEGSRPHWGTTRSATAIRSV